MVHADQGPHLVGVWYRPPAPGETGTVLTFKAKNSAPEGKSLRNIVLGDMNVHNRHWLQHSKHTSAEERAMQDSCGDIGVQQKDTQPTREDRLLDIVLTNMSGVTTIVLPRVADQKLVVAETPFKVPGQAVISRTEWRYAKAGCDKLRSEFDEANCDCMIAMDPDTASRHQATTIGNAKSRT